MNTLHRIYALARRFIRNDQLILLTLAIAAAVAATYGAIAFRELYQSNQLFAFSTKSEQLYSHIATFPAWLRVLAPALGGSSWACWSATSCRSEDRWVYPTLWRRSRFVRVS